MTAVKDESTLGLSEYTTLDFEGSKCILLFIELET
jgi:hypothetical protein